MKETNQWLTDATDDAARSDDSVAARIGRCFGVVCAVAFMVAVALATVAAGCTVVVTEGDGDVVVAGQAPFAESDATATHAAPRAQEEPTSVETDFSP